MLFDEGVNLSGTFTVSRTGLVLATELGLLGQMNTDEPEEQGLKTPFHTKPLDEAQRGAWFDGPDDIVALHEYDGDIEYELPPRRHVTVGASRTCDITIPGRGLSATHVLLERKGLLLRLHDQHSTNGTYVGGRRIDVVELHPGDTFTAAPVTFLAMNEAMRTQRRIIADILGANFTPSVDKVLVTAVKAANNLLLTGETGCDLDRLARAIHAVSLRRTKDLVEISEVPEERAKQRDIIRAAARSTLVINLERIDAPLDPAFCSMVFARDYHVRVIVHALTSNAARELIPLEHVEQLDHIWVRPISMRPGDVAELLDRMLGERQASFRLANLTTSNREAICAHEWRDNFVGLRLLADRLVAISRVASWDELDWRERAAAVGVPKSTLYDWFVGMGLSFPVFG